jgi:hypothetical protein
VVDNAGAEQLPLATLADTGQLADLTQLVDTESIDGGKIRDTLNPVALEAGDYGGKILVLNYALEVYGLWYDKTLFDEKGWQPAETWEDFLALADEIKGAGIAPMAHQGKYPYYIQQVLMDMAVKHGGKEVVTAIDSLEPNAWKHESVKLAAEALAEIKSKGYMLQGTEGLDHIQSQTRWNEGKAAFIPSGSWLENEQKKGRAGGLRHHGRADPPPGRGHAAVPVNPGQRGRGVHRAREGQERPRRPGVPAHHAVQGGCVEVHRTHRRPHRGHRRRRGPEAHPGRGLGKRAGEGRRRQQLELLLLRLVLTDGAEDRDGHRRAGRRAQHGRRVHHRRPEGGRRDRQGPANQEAHAQLMACDGRGP